MSQTIPINRKKKYYLTYKLRKSGIVVETSQKRILNPEPEVISFYQNKWVTQLQDNFNYVTQTTLKF